MKLNKIEKAFLDKAIIRNGIFLLNSLDAIKFVNECERQKVDILGIDAFFLNGEDLIPSLENSVDFTSNSYEQMRLNKYESSKKLIENAKATHFEIIIRL